MILLPQKRDECRARSRIVNVVNFEMLLEQRIKLQESGSFGAARAIVEMLRVVVKAGFEQIEMIAFHGAEETGDDSSS